MAMPPTASQYPPPFAAGSLRPPMGFPPVARPLMAPGAFPPGPPGPPPSSLMSQFPRMQAPVPPPPPPAPPSTVPQSQATRYMAPMPTNAPQAFSAPPTRTAPQSAVTVGEGTTIIEAKPVLRNKMAELTRFVPSSLVVRREQKPRQANKGIFNRIFFYQFSGFFYFLFLADPFLAYLPHQSTSNLPAFTPKQAQPTRQEPQKQAKPSTDAAYEAFMKEINKIL